MAEEKDENHYDLVVIGGGSGGMAVAKEAANLGAKVLLFDYVKPSPQGSKWGLGGTCVNVGCVPKKLCHYASILGAGMHDAAALGWDMKAAPRHDWETMVEGLQNHIGMLNFTYRKGLKSAKVTYVNALATLTGPNSVGYELKQKACEATGSHIVIAVGGRPHVPYDAIPGAREHAITSDDLFSLEKAPNKTLVVGGGYIAVECAGFLTELGYDVTVAVRTATLLRGFDRQCAEKIGATMADLGTKFAYEWQPTSIEKVDASGRLRVILSGPEGAEKSELFDTVMFATGRGADTAALGCAAAGVECVTPQGKFEVLADDRTNVPHIFAVGDVVASRQELTPVAVRAGTLLARRLFGGSQQLMDYDLVPTAVFTPLEYGTVGLSEEAAVAQYGAEDVETYLFEFTTLELQVGHRLKHPSRRSEEDEDMGPLCLSKLVCLKSQAEKVVGFHFVGPNAGEVTQGFALAVRLGATKADFDGMVGIHPTDAESFCTLSVTRSSGVDWVAKGGCGGGVCG